MALKPYPVPGLDKPLYLPDHIRVEIKIIPPSSQWGGATKSTAQTLTTWHDTGPTGGNADGEWTWANNGRKGAGPAGYNAIIDDDQIIICHPFDRVTWHAGTTEGNRTSWGAEQCREKVDRAKAITNAAAFHGALCAAKGWEVDTHLVQHHYWYGKPCPSYIRENGMWSSAVKQTTDAAAAARRAASGDVTGPQPQPPTYAKPSILPELDAISKGEGLAPAFVESGGTLWFWVGDRVSVVKPTGRYKYADKASDRVGPDLKPGEEFDVDYITNFNGANWYYTPYGTRVFASDVERVSDTKGEQEAA